MLFSCILAFFLNYSIFLNTTLNSALTQTICGNLKVCLPASCFTMLEYCTYDLQVGSDDAIMPCFQDVNIVWTFLCKSWLCGLVFLTNFTNAIGEEMGSGVDF